MTTNALRPRDQGRFFSSQIIAILAAILFPVFARAREKARQTSCLSNTKQLGLAYLQYAQDYDGKGPSIFYNSTSHTNPDGTTDSSIYWPEMLYPYIKNTEVLKCPSNPEPFVFSSVTTYNYPYNYYASGFVGMGREGLRLGYLRYPAEFLLFVDGSSYIANPFIAPGPNPAYKTDPGGHYYIDAVKAWHNDGCNVAFADGHSKWLGYQEVITNRNMWDPNRL